MCIKSSSSNVGDDTGKSVALSADGSILAIGSTKSNNQQEGMVRVFYWGESSWVEQGTFPGGNILRRKSAEFTG